MTARQARKKAAASPLDRRQSRPPDPLQVAQSKLVYRGYELEVMRAASGWRVGIYPRTADLPILGRCEVFANDPDEAVVIAKDRVDGANLL